MDRSGLREIIYQILFSSQFNNSMQFDEDLYQSLVEDKEIGEIDADFIKNTMNGIFAHYSELRQKIEPFLIGYKWDRVFAPDRTALLLAVYELNYSETPIKVVINEALNLVKKYSADKSSAFVNAILGKVTGQKNEQ